MEIGTGEVGFHSDMILLQVEAENPRRPHAVHDMTMMMMVMMMMMHPGPACHHEQDPDRKRAWTTCMVVRGLPSSDDVLRMREAKGKEGKGEDVPAMYRRT